MIHPRDVTKTFVAIEQSEGVGARVRRSIGRPELPNLDPFLLLDEFNVRKPAGFPEYVAFSFFLLNALQQPDGSGLVLGL